jgi:hypothetical protein
MIKQPLSKSLLIVLLTICSLMPVNLFAQEEETSELPVQVFNLNVTGGYGFPGADLAKRFGAIASVGGGFSFKTESNWIFEIESLFLFGPKVVEDSILNPIRTTTGSVIGMDGDLYLPLINMRGLKMQFAIGKILPIWNKTKNSGLYVNVGIGYMQHKILYDIRQKQNLPHIDGEYAKGYDRLSSGFSLDQFIGYYYMSNNRAANFKIGFTFTQAFTKNQRGFNYDTGLVDNASRIDLMYGIKGSWILPFYKPVSRRW